MDDLKAKLTAPTDLGVKLDALVIDYASELACSQVLLSALARDAARLALQAAANLAQEKALNFEGRSLQPDLHDDTDLWLRAKADVARTLETAIRNLLPRTP